MRSASVAGRIADRIAGRIAGRRASTDAGMVTAELALAIPALVLVLAILIAVVGVASDLAQASDAARSAARAASVGASDRTVVSDAVRLAPEGSDVHLSSDDGWVYASVSVPALRWGPIAIPLPQVTGAAPLETSVVSRSVAP
jgi:hypothetical protein